MSKLTFIDKFHIWRRKQRWNRQYKKGKWDYLNNTNEAVRYLKIVEFIKTYGKENSKILDLGCGEGVLNERLLDYDYRSFSGIDYSKISIKKANKKKLPKANYKVADLHYYEPDDLFDIIIFNEAFYYINDAVRTKVLNKMLGKLSPNGILITPIFKEGIGCWEYFEIDRLKQLEFVTVNSDKPETYWKVGVYKKVS